MFPLTGTKWKYEPWKKRQDPSIRIAGTIKVDPTAASPSTTHPSAIDTFELTRIYSLDGWANEIYTTKSCKIVRALRKPDTKHSHNSHNNNQHEPHASRVPFIHIRLCRIYSILVANTPNSFPDCVPNLYDVSVKPHYWYSYVSCSFVIICSSPVCVVCLGCTAYNNVQTMHKSHLVGHLICMCILYILKYGSWNITRMYGFKFDFSHKLQHEW